MEIIKDTIGKTEILIQAIGDETGVPADSQNTRLTELTGIQDKAVEYYTRMKDTIKIIAEDMGAELKSINPEACPQQFEVEFNMGLSTQLGPIVILSGKGEYAFKVKMKWEIK